MNDMGDTASHFSYVEGENSCSYLIGLFGKLIKKIHIKLVALCLSNGKSLASFRNYHIHSYPLYTIPKANSEENWANYINLLLSLELSG